MYAIERGMFYWYECLRGGRKGQFNPLGIRRITTVQASFQSQSVISFWQMELMSFAALLVSFTVAQQKIWTHSPGLSFQSWFELFLVEPLTPHRAPVSVRPQSLLQEALTPAHSPFTWPVHCVNIAYFAHICMFLLASRHQHAHTLLRRFSCCFQTLGSARVCSTEPGGSKQQTFVFSV